MVKRRNSPYASHDSSAATRIPIDCTPQTLPAMAASAATPKLKVKAKKPWSPGCPGGSFVI
jgi:hypothetical protein